jgi:hypothetical protein
MLIEDFDCNGLPDILLGDISFPKMVMGYNQGTFNKARIANQDTLYPSFDVSVNVENFPAGYLLDANVDGKKDLIVTPNATAGFNNFDQIHVYENKGTNTCPQLELMEKDFLVGDMIDLGTNAFPLVIDVDGDSLNDLLVGNFGVFTQSKTHESRISYLKNVGSKTNPKFHYITRDYLPIPQSRDTGLFPTAGDLDGDGDLDLLVGTDRGLIYYYENKAASRSDSAVWVKTASEFDTVNFGKSIRPYLFDVDNDGKLDLLIGSQLSSIKLYKNIGSTSIPNYSNSQVISNWGGIFVSNALGFGNLSIAIADLDTAGNKISTPGNLSKDRHVFVGTSTGVLLHYTGMNSSGNGNLTLKDSVYLYSQNISPSMGDITGDNKPDILYGQISGGLSVLLKDGGNIIVPPPADTCVKDPQTGFCVGQNELLASDQAVHVFPNPASSVLYVKLELPTEEAVHIEIRDLGGREIYSTTSVSQSHEISISDLGAGVYWVITSYQDKRFYNKVVKVNR